MKPVARMAASASLCRCGRWARIWETSALAGRRRTGHVRGGAQSIIERRSGGIAGRGADQKRAPA